MGQLLQFYATLEDAGECPRCGVRFAMPANLIASLRETKATFYCPNGHGQSYRGSETERLKRELEAAKLRVQRAEETAMTRLRERDAAELQVRLTRGKLRAHKQRAANGVCPCCKRSFVQLARHMRTKHPAWVEEQHKAADGP